MPKQVAAQATPNLRDRTYSLHPPGATPIHRPHHHTYRCSTPFVLQGEINVSSMSRYIYDASGTWWSSKHSRCISVRSERSVAIILKMTYVHLQ